MKPPMAYHQGIGSGKCSRHLPFGSTSYPSLRGTRSQNFSKTPETGAGLRRIRKSFGRIQDSEVWNEFELSK